MIQKLEQGRWTRPVAVLLSTSLIAPTMLAGCGNQQSSAPPPIDDTRGGRVTMPAQRPMQAPARRGLTTKQKVVLLLGAAALYYMYKKHQAKAGQQIQYYRSRNGRVYYREPNNPQQIHWVTPPREGFRVPANEADDYSGIEGYNNSRSGRGIDDLFPLPNQ
ncbi:MAG: hypothetical protein M3347_12425 [Armatimonadota bacterium]|nr:hypothetical protein [Armatimonadota bacterium]